MHVHVHVTFITEQKPYGKHKHFYGPLRALAVRASTGGLGRSVESRGRRRGDKELLLQSQQPSADGLRVSHDRSERDALLVVHLERARAPPREPVVGAVNRALALGSLGKLARLLAERARYVTFITEQKPYGKHKNTMLPASSGAAVAWACRKLRMACVFASKLIVAAWSQRTPGAAAFGAASAAGTPEGERAR